MTHSQVTVTTTATLLFSGTGKVKLRPQSGSVYLGGGSSVTSGTGLLLPGETVEFDLCAPAEIWGITSSGSSDVRILSWH